MLGQLFAILTSFCWAQNSISYNIAGKRVTSQTVAHIRLWIAFPAILIVHYFFFGSFLPPLIVNTSLSFLCISGLFGFFLADLCIFYSFVVLGPGRTMLILTLSPIVSALLSFIFIHECLGPMQIMGIIITVGGILLVIYHENKISVIDPRRKTGIIFALLGTLFQALGMVFAKIGMGDMSPISANVIRIGAGFLGLVIFSIFNKSFTSDFKKMKDIKTLSLISVSAIIGPILGVILTLYAFQLAPVGIVLTLSQITPIILLPIEIFFYKRKVNAWILLGTFVTVGGAVLLFLF